MAFLNSAGVASKKDFTTIGSVDTLLEVMPGLDREIARKVMEWAVAAVGTSAAPVVTAESLTNSAGKLMIDSSDVSYCTHCNARQPKDYKAGDLCPTCGKQAEPLQSCYGARKAVRANSAGAAARNSSLWRSSTSPCY